MHTVISLSLVWHFRFFSHWRRYFNGLNVRLPTGRGRSVQWPALSSAVMKSTSRTSSSSTAVSVECPFLCADWNWLKLAELSKCGRRRVCPGPWIRSSGWRSACSSLAVNCRARPSSAVEAPTLSCIMPEIVTVCMVPRPTVTTAWCHVFHDGGYHHHGTDDPSIVLSSVVMAWEAGLIAVCSYRHRLSCHPRGSHRPYLA